ncbi:hypothetical protein L6R50_14165 [Myxococcota bacterium]|nr:hypothetical protein [Myxococcota bacterium]
MKPDRPLERLLRKHEDEDLGWDDLVVAVRDLGTDAFEAVIRALSVGGEPHEGARPNPKWAAHEETLVRLLGALGDPRAIPWLEFVLHAASRFGSEGAAAEALQGIGTDEAVQALVNTWPDTSAWGDDGTDYEAVLVELAPRALPMLVERIVEEAEYSPVHPRDANLLVRLLDVTRDADPTALALLERLAAGRTEVREDASCPRFDVGKAEALLEELRGA